MTDPRFFTPPRSTTTAPTAIPPPPPRLVRSSNIQDGRQDNSNDGIQPLNLGLEFDNNGQPITVQHPINENTEVWDENSSPPPPPRLVREDATDRYFRFS